MMVSLSLDPAANLLIQATFRKPGFGLIIFGLRFTAVWKMRVSDLSVIFWKHKRHYRTFDIPIPRKEKRRDMALDRAGVSPALGQKQTIWKMLDKRRKVRWPSGFSFGAPGTNSL